MSDQYLTVDGLRVRYREQGSGPALILLHGAAPGTSLEVWEPNMEPLAGHGLRVIAPDIPGWGLTEPPADHSPSYRRRFVLGFMDALGLDKASLVGHSMSGGLVVQLAFDRPDRVERIVVLGSGTLLPPVEGKPAAPPAHDTSSEPTLEDIRHELEDNAFDHSPITPEVVARRHQLAIGQNFTSAKARAALPPERGEGPPLWQRLDQLPVPALLIYGRQDRGNIAQREPLARERYPNLNLHVFDGCKHMVQWDKADEFVQLTAEFVVGVRV